jgi:mRNA interferase YafQ
MRELVLSAKFNRDVKKLQRTGDEKALLDLYTAIESLATDTPLPERLKDHALTGQWDDCRDCHIRPDLVLIYQKTPGRLYLVRIASHSELRF